MIDPQEFMKEVISPALEFIGLNSEAARLLLLGTAVQESRLKYLKQINGPACSFYQLEPATVRDIHKNFLSYRPELSVRVHEIVWPIHDIDNVEVLEAELVNNLFYATIMARMVYYRTPDPLPINDIPGMAKMWKEYYNTHLGKGTEIEFVTNYHKYIGE